MGEIIMGTEGTVEITVGDDVNHAIAWWYREPPKVVSTGKADEEEARSWRAPQWWLPAERTDRSRS